MKAERDFLVRALINAGIRGKIHESIKSLKNSNEVHLAAILRVNESFVRSGSKKKFTDQEGHRKQRSKLFNRVTTLHVVIGDSDEEKVEKILTAFLEKISNGLAVDGNWVGVEIGDADWIEEQDSILKSKIAVEFDVTLTGGIYVDTNLLNVSVRNVDAEVIKAGGK